MEQDVTTERPQDAIETGVAETRQRIIEAAARHFSELGYTRATTRRIAAAADVNEVTLFRHFGSKQNLMIAVMDEYSGVTALKRLLAEELSGDYEDDLRTLASYIIDMQARGHDMMRIMMCESQHVPELRDSMRERMHQRRVLLNAYFQQQVEAGHARHGLDADMLTHFFFGSLFSYSVTLRHQQPARETIDADIGRLVDVFIHGTGSE